jgi:ligand-binding SRPBCC domain-containing protein
MKVYQLKRVQQLPVNLTEAWDFFSSPLNLSKITPASMAFQVLYDSGEEKMYAGQIIHYRLQLAPGIKTRWTTEITHVADGKYFIDEQRFGPYAFWHHQHIFKAIQTGVEMTDEVNYAIPYGLFGRFANWLFVDRMLNRIFDYRFKVLQDHFNRKTVRLKTVM